jgi:hypothetical protein
MKKTLFVLIGVLALIISSCSTDKPSNDVIETPKAEKFIGKYLEKTIFNSFPKYSIEDYGAYYYTIEKNNKLWLVEYNLYDRKGFVYSQINSIENGICKMNGYWEGTDANGNTIHGDSPSYVVDFSKQGIITSDQAPQGFVFYY